MTSEVLENLKKARGLIAERGWNRGTLYEPHNGYCILGAVAAAKFDLAGSEVARIDGSSPFYPYRSFPEVSELRKALPESTRTNLNPKPRAWAALAKFNDHRDRTKGEVLEVLDRAIGVLS